MLSFSSELKPICTKNVYSAFSYVKNYIIMQSNGLFNEIIAFFLQVPSHFFFISKIYPDFVALMSVGWGFYMGDTDYCMGDTGYIWPCTQCTYISSHPS